MSRTLLVFIFGIFAVGVLLAAGDGSSTVTTPDGFKVDFVGQSGQIKLYPNTENANTEFIKIKWAALEEVDTTGKTVASVKNFASQDFTWTVTQVDYQGSNATRATLTSALEIKSGQTVDFAVSAWIYNTEVTVKNGNETVFVPKNNVKFSISIEDWPFSSMDNTLQFGAIVNSPNDNDGVDSGDNSEGARVYTFGPGNLNLQKTCVADGKTRDVATTITGKGANTGVQWTFPSFTDRMDYDPTLGFNSAAASTVASLITMITLAVFAIGTSQRVL